MTEHDVIGFGFPKCLMPYTTNANKLGGSPAYCTSVSKEQ